ncbi:hypothetical protein HG530_015372 [Fusarium avenaceum]|nr:hypothetical protein HG530_015372 [Fusarium avenaceum]
MGGVSVNIMARYKMTPKSSQTLCSSTSSKRSRLNTNTLSAHDVEHQRGGSVVLENNLVALGKLDVLKVLVKQVRAVHRASLGLGVELSREDRSGLVKHALVGTIVKVDKVLLVVAGEGAGVDGVTVVLAGDVAQASSQVESGNVVSSVTILELDGAGTDCKSQKLMAQTNTHDGDVGGLHEAGKVVDSGLAMGRVAGAVGDEYTIKVLRDFVDGVVVGENGDGSTTADKAAKDVLLHTTVDKSNVKRGTRRLNNEGSLGGDTLYKVDLTRVDKTLVLISIVLFSNGDPSQGRSLLSEVGDNGTGINTRDGGNALSGTPLAKALDSSPMAVVDGNIGDNDTSTLNVRRLEVLEKVELVSDSGRNTVVANQGLGEDKNLASVRGISHRLGVANKGGGEDSFTRDVGIGTKGLALEDGAILSMY